MPSGMMIRPSWAIASSACSSLSCSVGWDPTGYLPTVVGEPNLSAKTSQNFMSWRLNHTGQNRREPRPNP